MALRLEEESVVSARICSKCKGRVRVEVEFADGSQLRVRLHGNSFPDLAGRVLTLRNSSPTKGKSPPSGLCLEQRGAAGEITAARKEQVPVIPMNEVVDNVASRKPVPTTWKNIVCLEWYSACNGRVVLESSSLELSTSEAVWAMSDRESEATRRASEEAFERYLDEVCVIDREEESARVEDDGPMDEFEWERFLRHSDKLSRRYAEVVDKFGLENAEMIAKYMKWDREGQYLEAIEHESPWNDSLAGEWTELEADEPEVRRRHPLHKLASDLLDSIECPPDEPDPPLGDLWSAVATVSAKLAGALSSYEYDDELDAGFTIAQLKRCLVHIDGAVAEAQRASPAHIQPLLEMRQAVIDLQGDLRKSM